MVNVLNMLEEGLLSHVLDVFDVLDVVVVVVVPCCCTVTSVASVLSSKLHSNVCWYAGLFQVYIP